MHYALWLMPCPFHLENQYTFTELINQSIIWQHHNVYKLYRYSSQASFNINIKYENEGRYDLRAFWIDVGSRFALLNILETADLFGISCATTCSVEWCKKKKFRRFAGRDWFAVNVSRQERMAWLNQAERKAMVTQITIFSNCKEQTNISGWTTGQTLKQKNVFMSVIPLLPFEATMAHAHWNKNVEDWKNLTLAFFLSSTVQLWVDNLI